MMVDGRSSMMPIPRHDVRDQAERWAMSEESEVAPRREVSSRLLSGLVVVLGGAALAGLLWWLTTAQTEPPSELTWTPPIAARVEPGESERYVGTASCRE